MIQIHPRTQAILLLLLSMITTSAQAAIGSWLYETNLAMEAWLADLEEQSVTVGEDQWHYYVKGSGRQHQECTVLVHGFTAEAAHWFRFARHLDDACIIVPDLPAFGQTSYRPGADYSIPAQVFRLHAFLATLNLASAYHLAGSSMGGHLVATYAVTYPESINTLALFDAGGVTSPTPSEMDRIFAETGKSIFEVESQAEFDTMFAMTMNDPPWMPGIVKRHVGANMIARTERHRAIFKAIYGQDKLDAQLSAITVPTLVLWGEEDKLLHADMAHVFATGIANATQVSMPGIGHLPFLEQPGKTAAYYRAFRGQSN